MAAVGAGLVLISSSTGTSRPRKSSTAFDTKRLTDTSRSVAASRRRACRDSLSRTAVVTLGSWLDPRGMDSPYAMSAREWWMVRALASTTLHAPQDSA